MSSMEPPPFQEAARCDVCKCSFNTFRRRHHCRCCGRTLCSEHSSNQMVLPQFGIHTPVRVCANCYNKSSVSVKGVTQTSAGVNQVSDAVARLDIHADIDSRAENIPCHQPFPSIMECRCGMPLCICEPTVHPGDAIPQQGISANVQPIQKPNKIEIPRNRGITNNKSLHISTTGQEMDSNSENLKMDYEANGEGLREAIKNDDIAAVKKLLKEGVNANYRDKQRMSLLHLAAVFNRTDIAFILMDCGASTDYQNAQGETPLDCAPATLQYKMRKRMEERNQRTACQTDHP